EAVGLKPLIIVCGPVHAFAEALGGFASGATAVWRVGDYRVDAAAWERLQELERVAPMKPEGHAASANLRPYRLRTSAAPACVTYATFVLRDGSVIFSTPQRRRAACRVTSFTPHSAARVLTGTSVATNRRCLSRATRSASTSCGWMVMAGRPKRVRLAATAQRSVTPRWLTRPLPPRVAL